VNIAMKKSSDEFLGFIEEIIEYAADRVLISN